MNLESHGVFMFAVFQSCNLQEPVAVTGSQTGAIEVKLTVIDVVLMISFNKFNLTLVHRLVTEIAGGRAESGVHHLRVKD